MTQLTAALQQIAMGVFVVTLIVAVYGWRRYPAYRGAFLPPVLFAGFGVVYYALVLTGRLMGADLLLWGAVHRLLGGVVVLGAAAALVWALGGKRG